MNKMYFKNVKFILSAPNRNSWINDDLKEICFLGKSNVGKSTLINTICMNKKLARTSSTPGCTKLLNFFDVNGEFRIVDAPGYGFAKASLLDNKNFIDMMHDYVNNRKNAVLFIQLLDSRRIPSSDDILCYNMLKDAKRNILLVATKSDKLNQSEKAKAIKNINGAFKNENDILFISKNDKKSIEKLIEKIRNNI